MLNLSYETGYRAQYVQKDVSCSISVLRGNTCTEVSFVQVRFCDDSEVCQTAKVVTYVSLGSFDMIVLKLECTRTDTQ